MNYLADFMKGPVGNGLLLIRPFKRRIGQKTKFVSPAELEDPRLKGFQACVDGCFVCGKKRDGRIVGAALWKTAIRRLFRPAPSPRLYWHRCCWKGEEFSAADVWEHAFRESGWSFKLFIRGYSEVNTTFQKFISNLKNIIITTVHKVNKLSIGRLNVRPLHNYELLSSSLNTKVRAFHFVR